LDEAHPGSQWNSSDLQKISPYNESISAGDFIAGYVRNARSDIQIRFDLLDVGTYPSSDFLIALDTEPGGTTQLPVEGVADIEWDTLMVLPAIGSPKSYSSSSFTDLTTQGYFTEGIQFRSDLIPRFTRIPWQDYILVSINRNAIQQNPAGFKIQAFSTDPESPVIKDSLGPFRTKSLSLEPAPVLLAFWNSFPAYSPAQSLRRWDGAHTGPFGERHGLSILLNNVKRFNVPVALLDLRNPFTFSALDYLNHMTIINELISQKLLILPDAVLGSPSYPVFPSGLPDWAIGQYLQDLRVISKEFNIPSSRILFSPVQLVDVTGNYSLIIGPDSQRSSSSTELHIPYPDQIPDEAQATPDGLPLSIRKILIDHALQINESSDSYPLLVLGGSLPDSTFADPTSAAATMSYIANHPWIKSLSETELRSLPDNIQPIILSGKTFASPAEEFSPSAALSNIPNPKENSSNPLISSIWATALSLYAPLPPESETLPSLRSNYSGKPGIDHAAASWSENPQPRLDCQTDPDQDGSPECILASKNQFAIFELDGGRLVAYYTIIESVIHQIIAPSSQFIVGFGDPSTWNLDAGEGSETFGIHGAFVDSSPPWDFYNVSITDEQLTFSTPNQNSIKTYSLLEDGIQVNFSSSEPISIQIPIAIDPWRRFSPDWREYIACQLEQTGFSCRLPDDSTVEIRSDSKISAHSFTDSYSNLNVPEDPNFNYLPGHYLPFPIVLLEMSEANTFSVLITSHP
jgi:hypothetical protein